MLFVPSLLTTVIFILHLIYMSYIFQVLRDKEFETGSSKATSGKNLDSGVSKQRQVSSQSDHMQSKQVLLHSRDCMDGPHATPPFEALKPRK